MRRIVPFILSVMVLIWGINFIVIGFKSTDIHIFVPNFLFGFGVASLWIVAQLKIWSK